MCSFRESTVVFIYVMFVLYELSLCFLFCRVASLQLVVLKSLLFPTKAMKKGKLLP